LASRKLREDRIETQEAGKVGLSLTRITIASFVALSLLPLRASDAGLLDMFKGSSKSGKPAKHVASKPAAPAKHGSSDKHAGPSKPRGVKLAALGPLALPSEASKAATACEPAKFRIVVDVGHTRESDGAISARNIPEYDFNLKLAREIAEKLKSEGFVETKLLVTPGKARPSLFTRVAAASNLQANLFLSIHHDSVPDKLLEDWEFEGKKSHFSDRFSGYSVWVSHDNPNFKTSLAFAEVLAKEMKAQGWEYAHQYTQPIMGRYQHPLLNKETGVYSHDELVVLGKTRIPAVLLEAGSIINRDEELKMSSPEHQSITASAVAMAAKEFCDSRWGILGPL
jgi:N-acetylmuramoyl-L-alanine amidase